MCVCVIGLHRRKSRQPLALHHRHAIDNLKKRLAGRMPVVCLLYGFGFVSHFSSLERMQVLSLAQLRFNIEYFFLMK